ncbi:ABC transporter substrate-binding protein [Agrobacterium larrymoorei]|uniref:Extracellular solute-binding protein n=1 Tax=Agrobacterium larrymoorei TaxID=160699 RepID=A0AAF0HBE8_9HYPH|nr:extracellular solute-binding protein [Agrobacterium larrymoorei]WHA44014.1 extracellular solute-binding protein [Agrobacterium larrymoorei]
MRKTLKVSSIALLIAGGFIQPLSAQEVPAGYPADYKSVIESAKKEGTVVVYSATDPSQAAKLLEAFKKAYPSIKVKYNDLNTTVIYNRVYSEAAANQMGADVVWSSAVDTQLSLVERGLAAQYKSPEATNLPDWANYKDSAYGTTLEPAAVVYNKTLIKPEQVPKTSADLLALFQKEKDQLKGKVTTIDPEKSGIGFIWAQTDAKHSDKFWDLIKAFGAADGKVYSSAGSVREKVVSGEHSLGFNVFGSYAEEWAKASPNLGVAYLSDFTPAVSRVAFATKNGPHPNAGKVFLDFMLSKPGQEALVANGVPSPRSDLTDGDFDTVNAKVGGNLAPIKLDAELLSYLKPAVRGEFMKQWKTSLGK